MSILKWSQCIKDDGEWREYIKWLKKQLKVPEHGWKHFDNMILEYQIENAKYSNKRTKR